MRRNKAMKRPMRISRCRVNSPIGRTLAADGFQCHGSALSIGIAKFGAMIPFEIKFRGVALQVLFRNMVERAIQTTLENGKAGLDRIRGYVTASVFPVTVIDGTVFSKTLADGHI